MKVFQAIEKYFWVILLGGVLIGLWYPVDDKLMFVVKPILMAMLFLVFLKTDPLHILESIKDYKLMIYIVVAYMLVIPVVFYFTMRAFDPTLAVGVLLLTSMPAGVSSPTLTDIVRGNTPLSVSIVIVTALVAPFTVPMLFWLITSSTLSINPALMLKDMAIIVFIPLLIAHILKKYFHINPTGKDQIFTGINILLLFLLVYAVISAQHEIILAGSMKMVSQIVILYVIFALLHVIGYFMAFRQNRESKVAIAIGKAYMNNGMAIVLAASHFEPSILVFMVLSEIPWNTLLGPFKRVIRKL